MIWTTNIIVLGTNPIDNKLIILTLSENFGLGIVAAHALNNGVTCKGEPNSVLEYSHTASVFCFTASHVNMFPA